MSQITTHEETIEGKAFTVYKLAPLDAQDLLIDLLTAVGPAFGSIAIAIKGDENVPIMDRDIDPTALSAGIGSLVAALDKKMMRSMVKTLAAVSTVDGQKLAEQLPVVFREDLSLMYRWLWFALGVQYGRFFDLLPDGASGFVGKLARLATSPDTSSEDG